jgi:hypothetical protein
MNMKIFCVPQTWICQTMVCKSEMKLLIPIDIARTSPTTPNAHGMLHGASTLDSGIQNQWRNSPTRSLLDSSCVIFRVGPGRVKYLYQHDFFTFSNRNTRLVRRFFWRRRNLRSTENSYETLLYSNAQELMDSKSNASPKVKSTPKSKKSPKSMSS